jgi:HAD superfamily 5'-nucleotidase-like hydrolase
MNTLSKEEYLKTLKAELNKLNFVPEDKFDSILNYFKDVDVIGFDVDFTLLLYNKKNMTQLIYDSIVKYLINHKNYPEKIQYKYNKEFVDSFSCKNIVIDYKKGNAFKLRKDKTIIKCYHGKRELNKEEINSEYDNESFPLFVKSNIYTEDFYINIDSFQPQNLALFMVCVDLFDKGELKTIKIYEDIITHIIDAMNYNYAIKSFEDFSKFGYYFPEIYNHPELYLYQYNCENLLDYLRKKGKKLFFATNSNYSYSHYILEKTMGENYHNYFDLCFYKSCKPGFFQDPKKSNSKCFFHHDQKEFSCTELNDEIYKKISEGEKILTGGSYVLVENYFKKMLNKTNIKCVFVGDNMIGDCEVPSRLPDWESVFIYDDIKIDFIGENPNNYQKAFDEVDNEKDKYDNTFSLYFENKDCLFALPNVEGFRYII